MRRTPSVQAIMFFGYLLGPRQSDPSHEEAWGAADVEDWIGRKLGLRARDPKSSADGVRHAEELLRALSRAPEPGYVRDGFRLRYSWHPEYQAPVAYLSVAESERVVSIGRPAAAPGFIPQHWENAVEAVVAKLGLSVWSEFLGVWGVFEPFVGPRPKEV